jgi:hypothetical protein
MSIAAERLRKVANEVFRRCHGGPSAARMMYKCRFFIYLCGEIENYNYAMFAEYIYV